MIRNFINIGNKVLLSKRSRIKLCEIKHNYAPMIENLSEKQPKQYAIIQNDKKILLFCENIVQKMIL